MIGVALIFISQVFAEIGTAIGKYEFDRKRESVYAFGFLNAFWITVFLLVIAFFRDAFVFDVRSLPTFALRAILEVILMFVSLHAIIIAERTTFAFIRLLTIPLLLGADILLGYTISTGQFVGIVFICSAFVVLFMGHGLGRRGRLISLFSALLAVGTLTLFKYNIDTYNSVEAEQALIHVIMLVAMVLASKWHSNERLLPLLLQPTFLAQSLLSGVAGVILSYAFLFAPASVITTGKRVLEVAGALTSGRLVFKEKHFMLKAFAFALVALGLVLLTL